MRQRIGRRLISIMLSVLMLVSLLPTAVFADELPNQTTAGVTEQVGEGTGDTVKNSTENEDSTGGEETKGESSTPCVAKVGGKEYATLEDAIDAASADGTVTLLDDVTLTVTLTITKNVTLDLSGKTLTVRTEGDGIVVNNAELTLANSVSSGKYIFDCSARGSDGVYVFNEDANTTSKLIVNSDVEIKVNSNVNSAIHAYAEQGEAIVNFNAGKIVVNGKDVHFPAIIADDNSTINVTGGEFELNVDFDSYSDGNDVVGVLVWGQNGVQKNIAVNITDGKFTVGGKNAFAQVVQIGMKNGKSENCKVSISGGEVVLNPMDGGKGYVYAPYETSYATAEITGGKISGGITSIVATAVPVSSIPNDGLTVSGGTFSTEVDAKHLAVGTELVHDEATGTYGVAAAKIAEVGGVVYPSLEAAFEALSAKDHTLKLLNESVWDAATPVYWKAGDSKYTAAATLAAALTAAYKANAGDITIVCRPGADVGTMTHGHVADNITIYGNDAYISGGECDLEVDTYMFSRDTGKQDTTNGEYLTKDITINAYELDNLGVWGQRNTSHTINVNLTDCDGKAIEGKENVQRVYISNNSGVTSSVNNITLTGCNFLTAKTAVYSNADGKIFVEGCSFTGSKAPVNINHDGDGAVTVEVKNSTFTNCGDKGEWKNFAAPIRFVNSGSGTMKTTVDSCTFEGTVGKNGDILIGDGRAGKVSNDLSLTVKNTYGWVQAQKPGRYDGDTMDSSKRVATEVDKDVGLTTSVKSAFIKDTTGTRNDPYTLEQLSEMTREEYITAQNRLKGTMYVTVGNYVYDTNGVLGNGERNDATGQKPDRSKLNSYAENGYLGEGNDGANGWNIVFVNGSITSKVYGYTSIDNIGTSLLLAVPAYTNVTFEGITFNNVMSFDYQLYTSPWSQLGELKFENCVFEGIIVGAIAAQELTFVGCRFEDYENSKSENSSNPTWIRPAYGNWKKGDNEGQGNDFRSLTKITFTNNTVTSTRPVKFERIAQWEMATTVTATGNTFTINKVQGDTDTKNVGMYFGANAKFDLVVDNNTAKGKTAGLYTAVYSAPNDTNYPGLPAGSTVKDSTGETSVDALVWKSTDKLTLKTTEEVAQLTNTKGVVVKFATLQEAIAEAKDGDTVTLLKSCSGNGIRIETGNFATKGLTVDFGSCTYTVGGVLVGSSGTGTNAFQLLEGGKITFQNGTIEGVTEGTKPAEDTPNWHGAPAIVIQNYCDLTLKDMTVSGGDETVYTVSNNHGDVVIENSIINAGNAKGYGVGPYAFDVCGYSAYDGVSVTVKGNSTINGDIEVSRSANNTKDVKLALESGTISGKLKIDSSIKNSTATTTVTKGSDVTVAAPVGYAWNAAGTLVEAVAQIGENGYVTLAAAIAAAKDGETVKLLKDVTEDVTINKGITLDLGGKTLTNTDAGKATISVADGVTATVKNGSVVGGTSFYNIQVGTAVNSTANLTLENVTATAGNTGSSMIDNWGTLTIESGTYEGGLNVVKSEEGSTLTINGGKFTLNHAVSNYYNGVILSAGMTTITGGEFIQQNATTPKWAHPTVVLAMKVDGYDSKIVITGGKFTNKKSGEKIFHGSGKATSDNFEVSGGTFNKSISDGYCAEGFIPTKNADGTYGVKAGKYVAKVGSKNYETLADAIRLAANGKTVKLLADVNENVEIKATKNLTLDLNGCTLNGGTVEGKAALTNYGTITIQNSSEAKTGTIKRDDNGTAGYYVIDNQGTMTIAGGHIYNKTGPMPSGSSLIRNAGVDKAATLNITGGDIKHDGFIAVKNDDHGILNISGGTITTTGDTETHTASAVQNWATATITGGTINGTVWTSVWSNELPASVTTIKNATVTGKIVVKPYSNDLNVKPTLKIEGGEFEVSDWDVQGNGVVAISGGTFNAPVKPEYCAPNHEPVKNDDGTYGVKLFYVAKIDGEEYKTLQEAISAAENGQKIYLLRDITVTDTVKFDKAGLSIAIDLQGHTITGDKCRALQVIDGNLVLRNDSFATMGEAVITSTGIATASSVIRVGDGDHRQAQAENMKSPELDIAAGVTVKAVCSYGITVFGYGMEKLTVNGKVISTATTNASYDGCAISTVGEDKTTANVTINGGTITAENTNAIYMPSGNLFVYNDATVKGLTGIYAKSGNVQIKGAKIYGTGEAKDYSYYGNGGIPTGDALVLDSCGYPNGAPTVNYDGAENAYFESTNAKPIGSYATEGNTKVTGFVDKGTFNKAIDKDLLADGYVCVYNGENSYGVATTENCVAKVGDIYYATLQDAIDAANSGDTVELVKDVDLTQTVVVDKTITLDMNGKKLHNTNGIWNDANRDWSLISVRSGDLTITGNGTLDALKDDCYAVDVRDNGKLTIENGKFVGNIHAVYVLEGMATINGGAYSVQQKFSAEKPDEFVLNCYDANRANGTAKIIVNGGTFQNFDPMNNQAEGKGTSFVNAEKYVGVNAVKNNDGTISYTAVENMTAQRVDENGKSVKAYTSLSAALADATAGQTVKLLNSVNGEKYVEVEANVTLDLNGHSITDARLLYVTGQIIDTAVTKGTVKADGYYINRDNEYTPVYDSEKDGYSLFKLSVKTWWYATEKKVQFALDRDMADFSAAVALMNANSNGRRVKAQVEFSWVDSAQNVKGKQAFELGETYMSQYLANASNLAPYVTIKGLETIEGTVSVQVSFVISKDELGNELFTLYGNKGTIKQ